MNRFLALTGIIRFISVIQNCLDSKSFISGIFIRGNDHFKCTDLLFLQAQYTEFVDGLMQTRKILAGLQDMRNIHSNHSQGHHVVQTLHVNLEELVLTVSVVVLSRNP